MLVGAVYSVHMGYHTADAHADMPITMCDHAEFDDLNTYVVVSLTMPLALPAPISAAIFDTHNPTARTILFSVFQPPKTA